MRKRQYRWGDRLDVCCEYSLYLNLWFRIRYSLWYCHITSRNDKLISSQYKQVYISRTESHISDTSVRRWKTPVQRIEDSEKSLISISFRLLFIFSLCKAAFETLELLGFRAQFESWKVQKYGELSSDSWLSFVNLGLICVFSALVGRFLGFAIESSLPFPF